MCVEHVMGYFAIRILWIEEVRMGGGIYSFDERGQMIRVIYMCICI